MGGSYTPKSSRFGCSICFSSSVPGGTTIVIGLLSSNGSSAEVGIAHSIDVLAAAQDPRRVLTDDERARAARLRRPADVRDFVAAHVLARVVAAWSSGEDWTTLEIEQRCVRCGGPHGKPMIRRHPELEVTTSRTAGNVAAAASSRAVAVDVERLTAAPLVAEVSASAFTDDELEAARAALDSTLALLRQWVRKECLVKLGVVSLDTLRNVDLSGLPVDEARERVSVRRSTWDGYCVLDWLDPAAGVLGSAVSVLPCRLLALGATAPTWLRPKDL
jgi:4'-phosphopantetheinyl transferase